MACFILDAWFEVYVLKAIKETALVSNNDEKEGKTSAKHRQQPVALTWNSIAES